MMNKNEDYQLYVVPFLILAPGGVGNFVLTTNATFEFEWLYSSMTAYNHAANTGWTQSNRLLPDITILITPGDTSSQFMNAAVPVTHLFGSGENPYVLPSSRKLPPLATMTFAVTNNDSTITYDLYLALHGIKRKWGG